MSNFSRDTFDKLKHYVGVRLQQGVPLVDADWNEQEDIRKYELQAFLKWFVGDGVPKGNDGFRIEAIPAENDFWIKGGDGTPDGAGRCLVEGWDVMNESDIKYTKQPLYNNDALAGEWDVDPLPPLKPPKEKEEERTDTVYLDVWERKVDAEEDYEHLVNPKIGIETCVRLKREWVVRVEGAEAPPDPPSGHVFYPLATLNRVANKAAIEQEDITDLRRSGLAVLSKELTIKDGNVGIGTTNPTGKLQIDAPAFADSKLKIGGIYGAGDGYAHHISSARDIVFNSQQGNWPDLRSSGFYFRRSRFDDLDSYVDLVHITLDGKVGIGTNSRPSERLTVEGNICATGRIIGNNLVVEAQIDDIDSQGASWGSDIPWSPVPKMEAGYTISIQQKTIVFFSFNIDMLAFYYLQGAGYVDFRILFNDREQVKKRFAVPEPGLSQIENIVLDGFTMLRQGTEIKLEWRVVQILLPGGNLASHVTLHSRTLNIFTL